MCACCMLVRLCFSYGSWCNGRAWNMDGMVGSSFDCGHATTTGWLVSVDRMIETILPTCLPHAMGQLELARFGFESCRVPSALTVLSRMVVCVLLHSLLVEIELGLDCFDLCIAV